MDPYTVNDLEDDPGGLASLVVRTDFSDDAAWLRTRTVLMQPGQAEEDAGEYADGSGPPLTFVDNPRFEGFTPEQFVAEVQRQGLQLNHLFVADRRAQQDEHSLLVIDLEREAPVGEQATLGRSFRTRTWDVGSIGANLSLINMDFAEFADVADAAPDGVFRGFDDE